MKGTHMALRSVSREQTELLDPTGSGTSSQSSSGVTGSMGDSSHPSPETLSQSSQDTSGSGSAMQVGRGGFGSWKMEFDHLSNNKSDEAGVPLCVFQINFINPALAALFLNLRGRKHQYEVLICA